MLRVNTVIFDIGRVLVEVVATGEKFGRLMRAVGVPPEQAFAKYWYAQEVGQHTTGEIDSREFYRKACERYGIAFSFEEFAEAWCDIFRPIPEMAELFEEVSRRHNVGILSDTDPLHWERILTLLPCLRRVAKPTLSFEVGYLKPHPSMFNAAAANCGRAKEECLFIDDIAGNIDGARQSGMQALRFTGAAKLRKDLIGLRII